MAARLKVDKCDCARDNCPGCFYPCESCGSTKCLTCRSERDWDYDFVEYIPVRSGNKSNNKKRKSNYKEKKYDEEEVNPYGNAFIQEAIQHDGCKEDANKTQDNIIITENVKINIENNENLSNEINNVNVELGDCEEDPNEVNEINVDIIEQFEYINDVVFDNDVKCIGDVDNSMQSDNVTDMDVVNDAKSEYVKENVIQITDVRSEQIADGPEIENIIEDTEEKDVINTLVKIINIIETSLTINKDSSTNDNKDKKIADDTEEENIEEIDVVFTDVTKKNTVENALENSAKNIIVDKDDLSIENKRAGEIIEKNCSEDIGVVMTEITEKDTINNFVENTIQSKTNIENTKKFVVESIEDKIVESTDKKCNESTEKETVGNKDKNTEEQIVVNTHEEGEKNADKCLNTDEHVLEQTITNLEQEVTNYTMLKNPESPNLQGMKTVILKNPEEIDEEP